jgi:2-dehydro-3-deoxyphosphogluconate aldolase/(4S)-4-hydroxy-2-oxoglutarate aldolase
MTRRWETCAQIADRKLIAIVRTADRASAETVAEAVIAGGIDVLEVSLTVPGALDAIETLARRHPAAAIGAGTVLDATSARLATLAGARFLVAPTVAPEVIATAHRYGAAMLAGAVTPTEIDTALAAGSDFVKLFPADAHEPGYARAIAAAMPQTPLVPTGGIDVANARAWLDAGAVALGVGGSLVRDPARAGEVAAELLAAVA